MDIKNISFFDIESADEKIRFIRHHNFNGYAPCDILSIVQEVLNSEQEAVLQASLKTELLLNLSIWNNLKPKDLYSLINLIQTDMTDEVKEHLLTFLRSNPVLHHIYFSQYKHHHEILPFEDSIFPHKIIDTTEQLVIPKGLSKEKRQILEKNFRIEQLEKQVSKLKKQLSHFAPFIFRVKSSLFDI